MFGRQVGYIQKRDGIGQTPCSYEHYLVFYVFKFSLTFVASMFVGTCYFAAFNCDYVPSVKNRVL